jgi:hypothetical protein
MHPQEWWWYFEAKVPEIKTIAKLPTWEELYDELD